MGAKNPFRYRGYYYDTETGLFYVVSRYYNPEIGRFISKDDQSYHAGDTSIDANLYAYCSNNPIMRIDPTGHVWGNYWWNSRWFVSWAIDTIISAIVCGGIGFATSFFRKQAARYGAREAAVLFSNTLRNSLLVRYIGSSLCIWVSRAVGAVFSLLMYVLSPGSAIFKYLDSIDRRRNNGYLNF